MDAERAYYRVHARLSRLLARLLAPRIRAALEHLCLLNALVLLGVLVSMHVHFVGQPACAKKLSSIDVRETQLLRIQVIGIWGELADDFYSKMRVNVLTLRDVQMKGKVALENLRHSLIGNNLDDMEWPIETLHITEVLRLPLRLLTMYNPWFSLLSEFWVQRASRRKTIADTQQPAEEIAEVGADHTGMETSDKTRTGDSGAAAVTGFGRGPLTAAALHYFKWWSKNLSSRLNTLHTILRTLWKELTAGEVGTIPSGKQSKGHGVHEDISNQWIANLTNPLYLYSQEKGYLTLSEGARKRALLNTARVTLSAHDPCFGGRWQRLLIDNVVGYDTILMNSLLSAQGRGYLYNVQTKDMYNLNHMIKKKGAHQDIEEYLVFKFGVLIMSLFVYFTTTMSVSFTLRETQSRMLRFTVQLQRHARQRLPTFRLIFVHVVESLVFVPIMIGILFFLFEFFNDQLLAFLVLTLVWLCELFAMISVRTRLSMLYFPRFFFLYFMGFHIYFFTFTYGFSYLAFFTMAAFMQHAVLFFWNRMEVPALQRLLQRRAQQQQASQPTPAFSTLGLLSALSQALIGQEQASAGMPLVAGQQTALVLQRSGNAILVSGPSETIEMQRVRWESVPAQQQGRGMQEGGGSPWREENMQRGWSARWVGLRASEGRLSRPGGAEVPSGRDANAREVLREDRLRTGSWAEFVRQMRSRLSGSFARGRSMSLSLASSRNRSVDGSNSAGEGTPVESRAENSDMRNVPADASQLQRLDAEAEAQNEVEGVASSEGPAPSVACGSVRDGRDGVSEQSAAEECRRGSLPGRDRG